MATRCLRAMEHMVYRPIADPFKATLAPNAARLTRPDWRQGLPTLGGLGVTLREVQASDAPALFEQLTTSAVARFISPPPPCVDGFVRFIAWTRRQRAAGEYLCFAVVPDGLDQPVGLFRVRRMDPAFVTAEWGFALAAEFWGTGLFVEGARLV